MMNNPLLNGTPQMPNGFGNIQQIMKQFNQFRNSFQGDPQQQIQQLLNSGKVSQSDYNRAVQMAKQLQRMIKPTL